MTCQRNRLLSSYAHLLICCPSTHNSRTEIFPSRLLSPRPIIFPFLSHTLRFNLLFPYVSLLLLALACSCFPQNRHIWYIIWQIQQIWCLFLNFGWFPVVLGLIPFRIIPLRLMWGIRLTQHSEIYQWLQLFKTVAGVPHHVEGRGKASCTTLFSFHLF